LETDRYSGEGRRLASLPPPGGLARSPAAFLFDDARSILPPEFTFPAL